MPALDNRPQLQDLLDQVAGLPSAVLDRYQPPHYPALQRLLDQSCSWVEGVAATKFNGVACEERYDGNGTNQMTLRHRPATSVSYLRVETPILGYTRVYKPEEIKLYREQGIVKVFTYKLAVEQSLIHTIDYQAWGALFPKLPQAVIVGYTYGFPRYDAKLGKTSLDGATWADGDLRTENERIMLDNLRDAAACDAAASFLAQTAGLTVGLVQSVSFDGYSRSMNPAAFGSQVQALVQRRDQLLARRRRMFYMSSTG